MKLRLLLASIDLAAFVLISLPPETQAQKVRSDKTGWVKSSLARIDDLSELLNTDFEDIIIPGETDGSTIGPPPFPLCLLPEVKLKQLIRNSQHHRTDYGSPTHLGQWHGHRRSLPFAGFRSYLNSQALHAGSFSSHTTKMRRASWSEGEDRSSTVSWNTHADLLKQLKLPSVQRAQTPNNVVSSFP